MLISTISTTITHEVDLGNGTYADSITITNSGAILSTGTDGIGIYVSPSISNAVIVNDGTILGGAGGAGIYINGPNAAITNYGLIGGGYGLAVDGNLAYLNNHGTIIGDVGVGNNSGKTSISMLVTQTVEPGAGRYANPLTITSSGTIMPSASGATGLILDGATVDTAGFISGGAGSTIGESVVFSGTGNELIIEPGASFAGAISGFTLGDTIVIESFALNSMLTTYVPGIGLELTDTAGNQITLDLTGNYTTGSFIVVDPPDVTTVTFDMSCFAAGTRILTNDGDRPVESLLAGQFVATLRGPRKIKWIGWRRLNLTAHPIPAAVAPICIRRGALGQATPNRDLYLSPDHALYLNNVLISAKTLLNGVTIFQTNQREVTYYHVELDQHGILFAEGVACETYLDTGNRNAFENGGAVITLHPDFAQSMREQNSCATFAESGPAVEAARAAILTRANIRATYDPGWQIDYGPAGALIKSRSAIPGLITPDPRDHRRLGIKIASLKIGGRVITTNHPALVQGWHDPEPDGRWTNGSAAVPAALLGGAKLEALEIVATLPYPLPAKQTAGNVRTNF
jgi:hypothetical protein